MTSHILIIEDEEKLSQFVQMELEYEGYRVTVANDGINGLMQARDTNHDLIIMDWMMPGISGLEMCRRLRQTGNKVPIIMVTARDEIKDRVAGLDAGADDYVVKPFSIEELLARVRVHLRRTKEENSDRLEFDDLGSIAALERYFGAIVKIELTAKEFDLLEYLLDHPQQVLTRDRILENVWGYDFMGDSNIIEVYIRYLRLKLEANQEPRVIQTVRGVGYALRYA
jgi:DNA-binding response OmpR family regulator